MTKREAKRWVCDRVAAVLEANTAFFGDVLYTDDCGEEFGRVDEDRIHDACLELAGELRRRSNR